ncbi:MAG: SGNH/GDSL hydrolase family protein [Spirochaetes bacterium]|nr:SGNH/GDSL hydrolase family protein [Spirochaetota bacterium]
MAFFRTVFSIAGLMNFALAQDAAEVARLIAASQAGSPRLLFQVEGSSIPSIQPSSFSHPEETTTRGGIPNALKKLEAGEAVTLAYLGGSITRADGYRPLSAKWIQERYPKAKVRGVNAGVSGTPTDLGALRVGEQVLAFKPDLVFVEFAVNGGTVEAMEGIVRQIWKRDPSIDIVFVYTIIEAWWKGYAEGVLPKSVVDYDRVAAHYGIPSIHMAREVSELCKSGAVVFKGTEASAAGRIVFSTDGVHPYDRAGARFYAAAIARGFQKLAGVGKPGPHGLAKPLTEDPWEDATMLPPEKAVLSAGWKKVDPSSVPLLAAYKGWFEQIYTAEAPGERIAFRFRGKGFGLFDVGAPEVGQLRITVDGREEKPLNRFGVNCNNRSRGQYAFLPLPDGEHQVILAIDPEIPDKKAILGPNQQADIGAHPEKYDRRAIYLGRILLRGTLLD